MSGLFHIVLLYLWCFKNVKKFYVKTMIQLSLPGVINKNINITFHTNTLIKKWWNAYCGLIIYYYCIVFAFGGYGCWKFEAVPQFKLCQINNFSLLPHKIFIYDYWKIPYAWHEKILLSKWNEHHTSSIYWES